MSPTYLICHSIARAIGHVSFQHEVVHRERLIEDGPVLIVCNHVSYLDPPMVGISYRKERWLLARKALFRGFGAWLYPRLNVIPVDQEQPDMTGLKNILRLLKRGQRVLLFPEGSRSWDGTAQKGEPGVGLAPARAISRRSRAGRKRPMPFVSTRTTGSSSSRASAATACSCAGWR